MFNFFYNLLTISLLHYKVLAQSSSKHYRYTLNSLYLHLYQLLSQKMNIIHSRNKFKRTLIHLYFLLGFQTSGKYKMLCSSIVNLLRLYLTYRESGKISDKVIGSMTRNNELPTDFHGRSIIHFSDSDSLDENYG